MNFNDCNVNNNKTNSNYIRAVRAGKYPACPPLHYAGPRFFSFENIYAAYVKRRKRKRTTVNALTFELKLEESILDIEER